MGNNQDYWWVLSLDHSYQATGHVMADVLEYICTNVDVPFAVIGNVEGFGVNHIAEGRITMNNLLPLVRKAKMFEWCDILCYHDEHEIPDIDFSPATFYKIVSTTQVTVRAVDVGFIEVATESALLRKAIEVKYPISECYYGPLEGYIFMR